MLAYLPESKKEKKVVPVAAKPVAKLDDFSRHAERYIYCLYDEKKLAPVTRFARDPFQPPTVSSVGPKQPEYELEVELTGVFESRKGKFAIVNQTKVREGDTLEGMVVKRIEKNGIYLSRWGKQFYVPMRRLMPLKINSNNKNSNQKNK